MLDGKNSHTHALTNFVSTNKSTEGDYFADFLLARIAYFREGMVQDIPTTIKFIAGDKVVSIWVDPAKVDNHFGDTPIYGIILQADDHGPKRMRIQI